MDERVAELQALLPEHTVEAYEQYLIVGRMFNDDLWRHAWKALDTVEEDLKYWEGWADMKEQAIARGVRWLG